MTPPRPTGALGGAQLVVGAVTAVPIAYEFSIGDDTFAALRDRYVLPGGMIIGAPGHWVIVWYPCGDRSQREAIVVRADLEQAIEDTATIMHNRQQDHETDMP